MSTENNIIDNRDWFEKYLEIYEPDAEVRKIILAEINEEGK